MSSFIKETKHPRTGKWEYADWLDDLFGQHRYGVIFPSDAKDEHLDEYVGTDQFGYHARRVAFDPEMIDLETR